MEVDNSDQRMVHLRSRTDGLDIRYDHQSEELFAWALPFPQASVTGHDGTIDLAHETKKLCTRPLRGGDLSDYNEELNPVLLVVFHRAQNLDSWKSNRRKRSEEIIERVVEVKRLSESESAAGRKKKTFNEMMQER